MKIGSILENQKFEKRVAIMPEIVKKYLSLGFEILLSKNYASHLGIEDQEYLKVGAKISSDENEILNSSDIMVQICVPSYVKISLIIENQILIGVLKPYDNKKN